MKVNPDGTFLIKLENQVKSVRFSGIEYSDIVIRISEELTEDIKIGKLYAVRNPNSIIFHPGFTGKVPSKKKVAKRESELKTKRILSVQTELKAKYDKELNYTVQLNNLTQVIEL